MKLEHRTDITAFYDLANCCYDDLEFISILLQIPKLKPNRTILCNIENLRVLKYKDDLNFLLDNLQMNTIKNLYSIYQLTQGLTDGNE